MAKTTASKKQKGSRLEKKIAKRYRNTGLFPDAQRQLLSGGGYLKGDIYTKEHNDFVEECKNQETVRLNEWWKQAEKDAHTQKPLLHISANYRPIISVLYQDDFMDMVWELEDYDIKHILNPQVVSKKRFNLWNEWDKCVETTSKYESFPLLYIDRVEVLVVVGFEDLLDIRLKLKEHKQS